MSFISKTLHTFAGEGEGSLTQPPELLREKIRTVLSPRQIDPK
jgi:hypothetical protein